MRCARARRFGTILRRHRAQAPTKCVDSIYALLPSPQHRLLRPHPAPVCIRPRYSAAATTRLRILGRFRQAFPFPCLSELLHSFFVLRGPVITSNLSESVTIKESGRPKRVCDNNQSVSKPSHESRQLACGLTLSHNPAGAATVPAPAPSRGT